ncbi:hypothetical protein D5086_002280 [Populus alba]|uniref:Uncharacterized protein n=1 Tax=Populus alba TaxID=43335 RepID=A0ACC4D287_POPAL
MGTTAEAAAHKSQKQQQSRVLIAGNYCHDVLIQKNAVKAVSLGGAASFISNVFNGVSISYRILKRVCACGPIRPSDLPDTRSKYGMAVGDTILTQEFNLLEVRI